MDPEFIVADEPISALDVSIRAQIINLLNKLRQERDLTYLFIAHDLSVVRFISDRIAVITKGRIVELADCDELFNHPLHPYTKALLSAIPYPDPDVAGKTELLTYDPAIHDYSADFDDDLTAATAVDEASFSRRQAQMAKIWAGAAAGILLFLISFLI